MPIRRRGGRESAALWRLARCIYPTIAAFCSAAQLEHLYETLNGTARSRRRQQDGKTMVPVRCCIFFGYMDAENDKYNYQGKPYDFVGFDELYPIHGIAVSIPHVA